MCVREGERERERERERQRERESEREREMVGPVLRLVQEMKVLVRMARMFHCLAKSAGICIWMTRRASCGLLGRARPGLRKTKSCTASLGVLRTEEDDKSEFGGNVY